ncbi:MAG: AAA family ATPase [Chloroflexota bacterium]|nr:AAA family ATPase [Chloroflexota bacterium]
MASLPLHPPPLVGREREFTILHERLADAIAGRGGLVLIGGEAGIGKTTLAESLCREARERGALALVGRCYDLTETPPYGPWLELFAHDRPADGSPPLPEAFARRGVLGAIASQTLLFQQVADWCAALATSRPMAILLEDVHWSDPTSLDLLRFLARTVADIPLLLLATYRPDEIMGSHPLGQLMPAMIREAPTTRLAVRRLDPDAVHALVAARYRLPEPDVPRLVTYLHERSEGNPFFIAELLLALEEEGAMRADEDGWRLGGLIGAHIPPLLRQVIDGRLNRLDARVQHLLAVAGMIGQEVDPSLWATVAGEDDETILAVAEQAIAARVLEAAPTGTSVRFVHALMREALTLRMLAARRALWHRRIAEALIDMPNPDPDSVAYHFQQAGDARAAEWLVAAGKRAQDACAFATAVARFTEALALLDGAEQRAVRGEALVRLARMLTLADTKRAIAYADEAVRIADATGDRALATVALYRRGSVHGYAGSYRQGLADLRAASDLFNLLPEEARARLTQLGGVSLLDANELRGTIANTLQIMGRYVEALRVLGRAPDQATAAAPPLSRTGLTAFSVTCAALGRPAEARAASESGRDGLRALRDYVGLAYATEYELSEIALVYQADDRDACRRLADEAEWAARQASDIATGFSPRTARVGSLVVEGEWAEARTLLEVAHREGGLPGWRLAELRFLGDLAHAQGDTALAWSLVRETLPDGPATTPGDVYFINGCAFQRLAAALALDAGENDAARAWLEAHDRWLAWSGAGLGRAEGHSAWAHYHRTMGDAAVAREHATQAFADATEPRQPLALLAAHRCIGTLDTDAARFDAARDHFASALALADACAAPFPRARTLLAVAGLHAATGNREAARAALDEVRAIGTRLGALPTLDYAARAANLSAAPAYPAGLSAREVEVLRLVAEGLTDGQVAERLFLSRRTIGQHLHSIYTKLGVPSRAAATRFASEHHLLTPD